MLHTGGSPDPDHGAIAGAQVDGKFLQSRKLGSRTTP
jgi:hypothetical protein